MENFQLRNTLRPHLEELVQETGETANLVILDNDEAFYLDKVDSQRILRVFNRIGYRAPLYCTGAGKVLLAHYSEDQLKRYLEKVELQSLTPNTMTSPAKLQKELARIRSQGFAYDLEECEEGARCAAVPLSALEQRLMVALSVSGPAVRLNERGLERAVKLLKSVASRIVGKSE